MTVSAALSQFLSFHLPARKPVYSKMTTSFKAIAHKASPLLQADASSREDSKSSSFKSNTWPWVFDNNSVKIYYEQHGNSSSPSKRILMLPTISSVSTVEEWRQVAEELVEKEPMSSYNVTILDWPGMGFSDRPKLDYNSDLMESFLSDFITSENSPLNPKDGGLVVFGAGHATTLLLHAVKKGLLKPSAVAAVAPTWAGPFPIMWGRDPTMESRYGFFMGLVRAPYVGWAMYKALVSNISAVEKQYKAHVYADESRVSRGLVEGRYWLTQRDGARYAPAAFLTGLMDPVKTREEFLGLYSNVEGDVRVLVLSSVGSPKRSKAEMEALKGAKGVHKYVEVPGALLPQEEYAQALAKELYAFLLEVC